LRKLIVGLSVLNAGSEECIPMTREQSTLAIVTAILYVRAKPENKIEPCIALARKIIELSVVTYDTP
jgi:hypothetical protein